MLASNRLMVLIPFVVACSLSVGYVFLVGADWGFSHKVGAMAETICSCLILSAWAVVPYLALLPLALSQNGFKALPSIAVLVVFAIGVFLVFDQQHHQPGDEGLYVVVPAEQLALAVVILLGWVGVRALFRWAAR